MNGEKVFDGPSVEDVMKRFDHWLRNQYVLGDPGFMLVDNDKGPGPGGEGVHMFVVFDGEEYVEFPPRDKTTYELSLNEGLPWLAIAVLLLAALAIVAIIFFGGQIHAIFTGATPSPR